MVHDDTARQAGEDRREDRPRSPVDLVPDARGPGAAHTVPVNPGRHRSAAPGQAGTMLRTLVHAGSTLMSAGDVRSHLRSRTDFPAGWGSLASQEGSGGRCCVSTVARRPDRPVECPLDGRGAIHLGNVGSFVPRRPGI